MKIIAKNKWVSVCIFHISFSSICFQLKTLKRFLIMAVLHIMKIENSLHSYLLASTRITTYNLPLCLFSTEINMLLIELSTCIKLWRSMIGFWEKKVWKSHWYTLGVRWYVFDCHGNLFNAIFLISLKSVDNQRLPSFTLESWH